LYSGSESIPAPWTIIADGKDAGGYRAALGLPASLSHPVRIYREVTVTDDVDAFEEVSNARAWRV
jgi:hypothetical protein